MDDVERQVLAAFEVPTFWKRFVDDVCASLRKDLVEQHLNSTINFTLLNTGIKHHSDGTLTTAVFRKKTYTDKYLSFDSHHPVTQSLCC